MNKQYMNGVLKWKKVRMRLMESKLVIALLALQVTDSRQFFQTIEQTEAKENATMDFLDYNVTVNESPNGHAHSVNYLYQK